MSSDQAQTQLPQPGQPIREGQLDEDKGQGGQAQDESANQGHLMQEGDGIPGETQEGEAQGEIPGEANDSRGSKGGGA
jgi:hypothetical protein